VGIQQEKGNQKAVFAKKKREKSEHAPTLARQEKVGYEKSPK